MVNPAEAASRQPPPDPLAAPPAMATMKITVSASLRRTSSASDAKKVHLVQNLSFPILTTTCGDRRPTFPLSSVTTEDEAVGHREETEAAARYPIPAPLPRTGGRDETRLEDEAADEVSMADWQMDDAAEEAAAVPWNLRTRRGSAIARMAKEMNLSFGRFSPEKRERSSFSINLTEEEIDEDIYAMTGRMARRRPRKKQTTVRNKLNALLPGSKLSEIKEGSYKLEDED